MNIGCRIIISKVLHRMITNSLTAVNHKVHFVVGLNSYYKNKVKVTKVFIEETNTDRTCKIMTKKKHNVNISVPMNLLE